MGSVVVPSTLILFGLSSGAAIARQAPTETVPVLAGKTHCLSEAQATQAGVPYEDCLADFWYTSVSVGSAFGDFAAADVQRQASSLGFEAFDIEVDDSRTAWKVGLGTHLSDNWLLELGYTDLGEVRAAFSTTTNEPERFFTEASGIHPTSMAGITLSLVYQFWRHEDWFLQARVGGFRWRGDYASYDVFEARPLGNHTDIDGTDWYYGVGGSYRIANDVLIHAEWERYHAGSQATDLLTIGASYLF